MSSTENAKHLNVLDNEKNPGFFWSVVSESLPRITNQNISNVDSEII